MVALNCFVCHNLRLTQQRVRHQTIRDVLAIDVNLCLLVYEFLLMWMLYVSICYITSPLAAHMCNACLISGCVHYVVTRRTVPLGADRVDTTYGTTWWETRLTIPARRAVPRLRRTSSARWVGFFVHYVDKTRSTNSSN